MHESTLARRPRGVGPFTYNCAHCGESFARRSRITGKRAFCSKECYQRATIKYGERACPICGITFSPSPGSRSGDRRSIRNGKRVYCSPECYKESRRRPRGICQRCGKELKTTASQRKYCSEECYRPPVFLDCKTCGKSFRTQPCHMGTDRQFCSMACYRQFAGESALEARVRSGLEALGVNFRQEYPAGRWSIDFALVNDKIAIEADGGYWHTITAARDAKRDAQLARAGWRIIRLAETEVNAARDVGDLIRDRIREATGLELVDLEPSDGTSHRGQRRRTVLHMPNTRYPRHRRSPRKGGAVDGQMALWG